jgi:hypothetical protein
MGSRSTLLCLFLSNFLLAQQVRVVPAPLLHFPGVSDSNSPVHWQDDTLIVFNSDGMPVRSEGKSLEDLGRVRAVRFYEYTHVPLWIEATWLAPGGRIYAWYHHETFPCGSLAIAAPEIGALYSDDGGIGWHDLGIVIRSGEAVDCEAKNGFFGGGTGDFTVLHDPQSAHFYFLFGHYGGPLEQQGVAIARLSENDLDDQAGKVQKWSSGEWSEPGLGGKVSPIFPATSAWQGEEADSFWGPSVHWNTFLQEWVMLLNRSCCSPGWPQEGVYISFNVDLSNPGSWSPPRKILDSSAAGWYPMVFGMGKHETDKMAGQHVRLFLGSDSRHQLHFSK